MGSVHTIDFDNPNNSEPVVPTKFAHIVLRTSDKNRLRDWYCQFLNAKVQHENEMMAFLTYDEEHHRIAMIQIPGTEDKRAQSCGLEHFAYTFPSIHGLMLAYRQRLQLGIKPHWCINHGPTVSLYYQDPDGNKIEWQVDAFPTAEEENAYMLSPEFKENPIGVDFDPEEMIERIKKGESEASLMTRPNVGKRSFPPLS